MRWKDDQVCPTSLSGWRGLQADEDTGSGSVLKTGWVMCHVLTSLPHTTPRKSRVALERRRRLERRRTPSMLSFLDHSWCVQSVPAVLRMAELQKTTLRCLIF